MSSSFLCNDFYYSVDIVMVGPSLSGTGQVGVGVAFRKSSLTITAVDHAVVDFMVALWQPYR